VDPLVSNMSSFHITFFFLMRTLVRILLL